MQIHRKKIGALFCAAAAALTLAVPAQASGFSDLPENHWAYDFLCEANALGILQGTGNGTMSPSGTLTWGQFLTMASRAFAPEEYEQALQEGMQWDRAGYDVLSEASLLEDLDLSLQHLGTPVTRQDAAVLLACVLPEEKGGEDRYWQETADPTAFSDWEQMDRVHQRAVSALADAGVIAGKTDGSFGYADVLQRCDGAVMTIRVLEQVDADLYGEPAAVTLRYVNRETGQSLIPDRQVKTTVGESLYSLAAEEDVGYYKRSYSGGEPDRVSSACDVYTVYFTPMSLPEIQEAQFLEQIELGNATWEEYEQQDFHLSFMGDNSRKRVLLFGDESRTRFDSREEAETNMTTISVPVWKLSGGEKVSSSMNLSIHSAIAEDVQTIFEEIYRDPEQFPIHSVGGYAWRGDNATGEHNCGTAIDINPNENYQIRNGQVLVGSCWEPGVNPYSIGPNSSVTRIFYDHGWSWGGTAWANGSDDSTGYHDYMHFSYLGG